MSSETFFSYYRISTAYQNKANLVVIEISFPSYFLNNIKHIIKCVTLHQQIRDLHRIDGDASE